MKKHISYCATLLCIALFSALVSCSDKAQEEDPTIVDADKIMYIAFAIVDVDGNDMLAKWSSESRTFESKLFNVKLLRGSVGYDRTASCLKYGDSDHYTILTSIEEPIVQMSGWSNVKLVFKLLNSDKENIVIYCDNVSEQGRWFFKGNELAKQTFEDKTGSADVYTMTLVCHDDGTYSLKE